jgi:hypothetical protein
MRPHSCTPTSKPQLSSVLGRPWPSFSTALVSALALCGVLMSATGCPAKGACLPCYVGGVMADGGTPNAAPKSTVNLQLDRAFSSETVSEVRVTLTDASGGTETLKYSGDQVKNINATSLTSIEDAELYSINGKPPASAEVELVFGSGKSSSPMPLTVKPEAVITTTPTAPK